MKYRAYACGIVFVAIMGACSLVQGETATTQPTAATEPSPLVSSLKERQALYAWFDSLGFPDVKGKPFVRLNDSYNGFAGNRRSMNYLLGWLIKEQGAQDFSVLSINLFMHSYGASDFEEERDWKPSFQKVDLFATAKDWLLERRKADSPENSRDGPYDRWDSIFSHVTHAFILARAVSQAGDEGLSQELFDYGLNWFYVYGERNVKSFQTFLSEQLGYWRMCEAMRSLGSPGVSREEILKQFIAFIKQFPEDSDIKRAKEAEKVLTRMVAEDKAHPGLTPEAFAKLSPAMKAKELVFQLRDQNGYQISRPGSCNIFLDPRGDESPGHQLLALELDAVPALIDALDDPSFTRSLGDVRFAQYSSEILRVGDAAAQILRRLAHRDFGDARSRRQPMIDSGDPKKVQEDARRWWAQVQAKGFKQVTLESLEAGDKNAPAQAKYVAEKYPAEALGAIQKAFINAKDQDVRIELIQVAGGHETLTYSPTPVPVGGSEAWLKTVMVDGPSLALRLAAAKELFRSGSKAGVDAMTQEWKKRDKKEPLSGTLEKLVEFLGKSGNQDAIKALSQEMDSLSVNDRVTIVMGVQGYMFPMDFHSPWVRPGRSDPGAQAIQALWVDRLEDTQPRKGLSMSHNTFGFVDPRVCDLAASYLAEAWPAKYSFRWDRSVWTRDRDRKVIRNAWLKQQGLAQIPVPGWLEIAAQVEEAITPKKSEPDGESDITITGGLSVETQ